MTQKRRKVIDHHTYRRHNGYATRREAERIQRQLKHGKKVKGQMVWYERVRIIKDVSLKTRKYVVWVNGKMTSGRRIKFK